MDEEAVGFEVGAVVLVAGGEVEEGEGGGGVEAEAAEEGVGEVVGEVEGEAGEGVGAVEEEEMGDLVEEFWVSEVVLLLLFSKILGLQGNRNVKGSEKKRKRENGIAEEREHGWELGRIDNMNVKCELLDQSCRGVDIEIMVSPCNQIR